jgi:hypothetical protein
MKHLEEIVKLKLDEMLGASHFSICSLDILAETLGRRIGSHPYYSQLRALHCVKYSSMSPQLRADIPNMIVACLRGEVENMAALMTKAVLMEGRDHGSYEDNIFGSHVEVPQSRGVFRLFQSTKG